MDTITFGLKKETGLLKPLHSVNNGPIHSLFRTDQSESNLHLFREAGIPFARNHDASFCSEYGGEHSVDVHAVFPDFGADPCDPASYDFRLTDEYLQVTLLAGTQIFYRLGCKIEHWSKKYGTVPPPDFQKWAVVCEHIIRHFNEGWANGFHMDIRYWEIWNEPDLDTDDAANKRTWGGTAAQFYELFSVTARHLKSCFPSLKIGGPAICRLSEEWIDGLFARLETPIDFFSWHLYARDPERIRQEIFRMRRILDRHGMKHVESILNEWNYVTSFDDPEAWRYSRKVEKNVKGSAFIAAVMCAATYAPLDMLMYYDARPCGMCGLFDTDFPSEPLKGYYPFRMFNTLWRLGTGVAAESSCPALYACAARGEGGFAAMVTHFDDNDAAPDRTVRLRFRGAPSGTKELTFSLLDADHDDEPMRTECFTSEDFDVILPAPLYGTWLIRARDTGA